jgi:hypothetical protein
VLRRLDTLPGPKLGIYGQRPHLASWGGNAILHGGEYMTSAAQLFHAPVHISIANHEYREIHRVVRLCRRRRLGEYHLFVSSMTEQCGLSDWPTNMQVEPRASQ